jgi:hypothetical protein
MPSREHPYAVYGKWEPKPKSNMTREQRDKLFQAHQELGIIHGHVAEVTHDIHEAGKLANKVLDAQLAISEAMLAVAKAMDMSPESD